MFAGFEFRPPTLENPRGAVAVPNAVPLRLDDPVNAPRSLGSNEDDILKNLFSGLPVDRLAFLVGFFPDDVDLILAEDVADLLKVRREFLPVEFPPSAEFVEKDSVLDSSRNPRRHIFYSHWRHLAV